MFYVGCESAPAPELIRDTIMLSDEDVLTQVPSNMIIGKIRPSYYICLTTSLWGILSMSQGFTKNFSQLAAVRFLLGLVEGKL